MISVVGHTAVDHIFLVPHLPNRHASTFVLDHHVYFGGGAANIAAGIATLGEQCTLVSAVGGDFSGSDYDRWMDRLGITKQFFVEQDTRTATAYMFNDQDGDQVTFFEWGASTTFRDMPAPRLDFVHMATADPDFNVRVAQQSAFASFDPGQDLLRYSGEQLDAICDTIDILFANQHEIRGMCEMMGVRLEELTARIPLVVCTLSGEGSLLYEQGSQRHVPALPVDLADPTGAGDAYRAGFLSALRKGYPYLTCAKIGTVTASFVVERVGCQTNLPDWQRMEKRYRARFGDLTMEQC
ncbi:MAG TPA: carbohydrate kinase family protein [Methanoculleus sp.]|nr:carbohydrate kinase family protein [Methanoculleus sp.]